jgi:hypothetical protein
MVVFEHVKPLDGVKVALTQIGPAADGLELEIVVIAPPHSDT